MAVLHHVFYCKVFADKGAAAVGNDARKLVVEVFSLVCGLPLLFRNPQPGFFPVLRPCMGFLVVLFPGKCLPESPQPSGMDFYPARVLDGFGAFQVPKHTKHLQPKVNGQDISCMDSGRKYRFVYHGFDTQGYLVAVLFVYPGNSRGFDNSTLGLVTRLRTGDSNPRAKFINKDFLPADDVVGRGFPVLR